MGKPESRLSRFIRRLLHTQIPPAEAVSYFLGNLLYLPRFLLLHPMEEFWQIKFRV